MFVFIKSCVILNLLPDTRRIVHGLLRVQIFSILDTKAEEVNQLRCGVDLCLPGILALAVHSEGHHIVAVLCGDQVGGLEENAGAISERSGGP